MLILTKGDTMDNKVNISNNDFDSNEVITIDNNKKSNKIKFIILIGVVLLILVIILFGVFNKKKKVGEDGLIYNNNESFVKEQVIENLTFSNIKCTYDGKDSLISYTISNDTDKDISLKNYNVIVKNKKGVAITKIAADFSNSIKAHDKVEIVNSVVGVDLTDAYSMELKLNVNKK